MKEKNNPTTEHIIAKRRAFHHERWNNRAKALAWYGLLAEVFLLPLSPGLATAALLLGAAGTAWRFYIDKEFHFRHLHFDVPAILFVLISALSVLASPDRGFSFYNYYNLVGVYVLTYLLVGQNVRRPEQMKAILKMAAAAAVIVIIYGYYQFLFGIDISAMKWVDGDAFPELRKRVFSTWENPNILAGYLDIIICLAFGLFMHCKNRERRILLGVFMLAAAACLAMTYARGACLVIAVILAGYGALKDRRVLVACIAVVAILFAADPVLYERITSVFTKVDTSTEMRLAFWESTIAMIQDHPFLGIGWGAYWMVYPEYDFYLQGANVLIVHAHNIYLNYMAEIGIPGAVAFFWFFFGTMFMALRTSFQGKAETEKKVKKGFMAHQAFNWKLLWRDWEEEDLLEGLAKGIGLAVLSIALNGITDDLLFNIPSSMVLWMMAALAGVLSLMSPPKAARETNAASDKLAGLTSSLWQHAKEVGGKVNEKTHEKMQSVLTREVEVPADDKDESAPAEKDGKSAAEQAGQESKKDAPAAPEKKDADAAEHEKAAADAEQKAEQKPMDPMDELAEEVRKALLQRKEEEEAAAKALQKEAAAKDEAEKADLPAENADKTAAADESAESEQLKDEKKAEEPDKAPAADKEASQADQDKQEDSQDKTKDETAAQDTKDADVKEEKDEKEADGHEKDKHHLKGDD